MSAQDTPKPVARSRLLYDIARLRLILLQCKPANHLNSARASVKRPIISGSSGSRNQTAHPVLLPLSAHCNACRPRRRGHKPVNVAQNTLSRRQVGHDRASLSRPVLSPRSIHCESQERGAGPACQPHYQLVGAGKFWPQTTLRLHKYCPDQLLVFDLEALS